MMIFIVKQTSGCCCIIFSCYCNIFSCNCENPYGYRELCSDKRMERSNDPVMKNIMNNSQYIKLYGHLIGIPALDVFYYHDLNKDGVISFEEMQTKNITKEDFNIADLDQDGFIIPAELDDSLN